MTEQRGESDRVADLLDLHEGRLGIPLLDDTGIRDVLTAARQIAVIGASADPGRPSNGVLRQLRAAGYDIVDVFRRSDQCTVRAREAVAVGAACLWLQLGVVSGHAGRIVVEGGLKVVMDRCIIIEYRRSNL